MLMLELLLGFSTVTVTALGGALGTEGTQADRTRLKSDSRKLQATDVMACKRETREMKTRCSRKGREVFTSNNVFFLRQSPMTIRANKNRLPCF